MTFNGKIKVIELLQTSLLSDELQDPWSFFQGWKVLF